ncbi:class I SAM-dependent methyltransferase [Streptosporangium sp. KLBMP 9127]|nr:class I SAM-dependent methyltransferase [Streptosporangium sp. KLBMP 9127]
MPSAPWTLDGVPGLLDETDTRVLDWSLGYQSRFGIRGDLLELGAYVGKSAILIGRHRRADERFTVCDLFESDDDDTLSRTAFEANYLAFHEQLPEIVQGHTALIRDHVERKSCRFVHVDASTLYDDVNDDLEAAKELLDGEGIVVIDGYRAETSPGVAAAVWEAVAMHGLRPIYLSPQKFYGTWGDPGPMQTELAAWLATDSEDWTVLEQSIAGRRVIGLCHLSTLPSQTLPLPECQTFAPSWTEKTPPRRRRKKKKKTLSRRLARKLRMGLAKAIGRSR